MSAAPASPTPQHRWLVPVLVLVVSTAVGGGLIARELYRQTASEPGVGPAVPTSTSRPLADEPGPATVELTPDAAAHPEHEAVRAVMQAYFDAINGRDYEAWKGTVTKARIQAKPRADWLNEFRTTKDGSILIYRIDSVSDKALRVFIGFISTQDPSLAPRDLPEACVRWNLTLPLIQEAGRWKVDTATGLLSRC